MAEVRRLGNMTTEKKRSYMRDYNLKNREKLKAYFKERREKNKIKILNHYSKTSPPSCECCGELQIEFLTLDHIYGDGAKHKKSLGIGKGSSGGVYGDLIKKGFPEGYRVLCYNCNCALGFLGYCPHGNVKTEKRESNDEWPLFFAFGINQ